MTGLVSMWSISNVGDFRRVTHQSRRIYRRRYLKWMKQNRKMSTCNWLDLESLGPWSTLHVQRGGCVGQPWPWIPRSNLGPLHTTRLTAHDHHTSSTRIGGKGGASLSSLHTTLEGPTEYIGECKMDVKSTMHSYMASNGSCFVIIWILFKNHLL